MIKDNALQSAFNNFKNMLSEENKKSPGILGNLLTGRAWNQDIGSFGGKLIKPIPERDFQDNNNSALQQYYAREITPNIMASTKQPMKTVQYPSTLANNNGKSNPILFKQLYEKAFETNPSVPLKVSPIKQAPVVQVQEKRVIQPNTTAPVFKFQNEINQASKSSGLDMNAFHLLRAGENQAENPSAINYNSNGTLDVGLFQINVDPNNTAEVERLKNPVYNATRAAEIFKSRMKLLKDPVLAIASYNLGAGGAVLNPEAAFKRAQFVYEKAGIEMPQTEFAKNPLGYVRQNMDYYRKLGLFK